MNHSKKILLAEVYQPHQHEIRKPKSVHGQADQQEGYHQRGLFSPLVAVAPGGEPFVVCATTTTCCRTRRLVVRQIRRLHAAHPDLEKQRVPHRQRKQNSLEVAPEELAVQQEKYVLQDEDRPQQRQGVVERPSLAQTSERHVVEDDAQKKRRVLDSAFVAVHVVKSKLLFQMVIHLVPIISRLRLHSPRPRSIYYHFSAYYFSHSSSRASSLLLASQLLVATTRGRVTAARHYSAHAHVPVPVPSPPSPSCHAY